MTRIGFAVEPVTDTSAPSGIELVGRFLKLVTATRADPDDQDKRAAAFAFLHDDVVVREPPDLPFGGEYHGPEGYLAARDKVDSLAVAELAGPVTLHDAGDLVVMRVTGRFTSRATGTALVTEFVELYTIRDGRIAVLDVYVRDTQALATLLSEPARGGGVAP
jgi:ketosteroid isomerase-like protein